MMATFIKELPEGKLYHFNVIYNYALSRILATRDQQLSLQFVEFIVGELSEWGYNNCYYHDKDSLPGRNVFEELYRAVSQSRWTIVIVSEEFSSNVWVKYCEQALFWNLMDEKSGNALILIVLGNVIPPKDLCTNVVLFFGDNPETWRGHMTELRKLKHVLDEGLASIGSGSNLPIQEKLRLISKRKKSNIPKKEELTLVQGVEEQNLEKLIDEDKDKKPVPDEGLPVAGAEAPAPIQDLMSEEEAILKSVRNNSCQEIEQIIQNKRIPAVKVTEAAIKECGFSQGVQCLLREISNALKKAIPDAASTWCGYRPCNPSIPVFVVSLSQQKFIPEEHAVFTKHFSHYDIEFRQDQEPNDEETIASEMLKEMAETRTVDDEMLIVQSCIEKHIKRLMQEHSNLSIVKASTIKTSAFSASDIRVVEQPCIVLYVPVKGIIPFGEKEFEKTIEGIPTDVREGEFVCFVRHKAHKYHKTLKMGCLISTEEQQTGTLGGFVDLPDAKNKIGFLTSAHVVLNNNQIKKFRKSITDQHKFNEKLKKGEKVISIYQPNRHSDAVGRVYHICIEPGNEKAASVDVAVVEITNNDRIPDSGEFPDGDFKHIGYTKEEPMVFNSGEIDEEMQPSHKGCLVIKYGAISGITRGCLDWVRVYAKEVKMIEKLPFSVLYNQISVKSADVGQSFACAGDSGALVFRCDGGNLDNLKVIGMVIGGSTNHRSGQMFFVTPIQEIFRKLYFETRDFKRFIDSKYSQEQGSAVADTTDTEKTDESQQVFEKRLTRLENAVAEIKDDINEIKEIIKSLKATETGFISSIKNKNTTT